MSNHTIPTAAKALGIKEFHMRQLLRDGKIPGATKELIPNTKTERWSIPAEGIQAYADKRGGGVGKRSDGRNKFNTWFTPQELEEFIKYADAKGIPHPKRANQPKAKVATPDDTDDTAEA